MRSSIDHLPKFHETPKYSPPCFVSRPIQPLPKIVICRQRKPQRAADLPQHWPCCASPKRPLASSTHQKSSCLSSEENPYWKWKCVMPIQTPTKSSDIDIVSLPLVTHLQKKSMKIRKYKSRNRVPKSLFIDIVYSLISLLEPSLQATTTVGIFWKSLFWLHQSSLIIPRNAPSQKFLTKTQFWVTKNFFDQSFAGCQQLQRNIGKVHDIYTRGAPWFKFW